MVRDLLSWADPQYLIKVNLNELMRRAVLLMLPICVSAERTGALQFHHLRFHLPRHIHLHLCGHPRNQEHHLPGDQQAVR